MKIPLESSQSRSFQSLVRVLGLMPLSRAVYIEPFQR